MARSRRRQEETEPGPEKRRAAGFWPLYLIGAIVIGLIVASMVFTERTRSGNVGLGGRCGTTDDCRDTKTTCYNNRGHSSCVQTCSRDETCFSGTKCTTIATHKRRRRTRLQKLCLPEGSEE